MRQWIDLNLITPVEVWRKIDSMDNFEIGIERSLWITLEKFVLIWLYIGTVNKSVFVWRGFMGITPSHFYWSLIFCTYVTSKYQTTSSSPHPLYLFTHTHTNTYAHTHNHTDTNTCTYLKTQTQSLLPGYCYPFALLAATHFIILHIFFLLFSL